MDDFSPAKNLMTMCFTYFYIGEGHPWVPSASGAGAEPAAPSGEVEAEPRWRCPPGKSHAPPLEAKEKPAGSIDSYLRSANSWLAEKKDIAERLLKNTSARTENVKGFFGGLETKLKGPAARKSQWVPPGRAGGPGRRRDTRGGVVVATGRGFGARCRGFLRWAPGSWWPGSPASWRGWGCVGSGGGGSAFGVSRVAWVRGSAPLAPLPGG